jgi:D-lactate dehydrogenase (cytochrome)
MLIKTDQAMIKSYLEDTSVMAGAQAEAVIIPEDQNDVARALKEAAAAKTPLTISAGKTGTTGGCIPLKGKVLSTEKLNRILNLDKKNLTVTVECGVILADLQKFLSAEHLCYPPDPTETTCFIGGTLSTNASGSRTFKYGPTRQWVERIKVILSSGTILNLPRGKYFAKGRIFNIQLDKCSNQFEVRDSKLKGPRHPNLELRTLNFALPSYEIPLVKNAAGYYVHDNMDLVDLFIGAEGTLGIIVEADLKLMVEPEKIFGGMIYFNSDSACQSFVKEARQISLKNREDLTKLSAVSLEYFDRYTLELIREKHTRLPQTAAAAIFFEQESTERVEDALLEQWCNLIEKHGASLDQCQIALTAAEDKELREIRHAVPETVNEIFKRTGFQKLATDIAVPADKFDEMLAYYNEVLEGAAAASTSAAPAGKLQHLAFGHIGNFHLHVNQLPKNEAEKQLALSNIKKFVDRAVKLGGTVSAEHGIGKIKKPYLKMMYGEEGIKEMAVVKKALDPALILNLDNVIEEKYLF